VTKRWCKAKLTTRAIIRSLVRERRIPRVHARARFTAHRSMHGGTARATRNQWCRGDAAA